ncbi:MAG TPA: site-specific DNA-methyltransferase [Rectinemataceae bacterium]|nr:site-specific DNA-methyltransferase [Rectinemataceae bacterium]
MPEMPASDKIRPELVVKEERLARLRELFPEALGDGKIQWDYLKEALGEFLEDDDVERFGLSWPGKREAKKMAYVPPKGTLRPKKGEGVDEKKSGNLIIEGDNLEVLKLLQKSYFQSIKMIYIDPPYNTGNDFVYNDNFTDTVEDYLRKTGQLDAEGRPLSTNPRTSGRFHSNWLSMMYPRLVLAKNLLRDDGVIFVSIDDNEVHHLRQVMDEVFGEENFVATFGWEKRTTRENRRVFSFNYEYICCYARSKESFEDIRNLLPVTDEVRERYSNPDNDPRGAWQSVSLNAQGGHATKSQFYNITTPGGRVVEPPAGRCWIVTKTRFEELVADDRIWFGIDGNNVPREKTFLCEAKDGITPHTLWNADEVGTNDNAKKELNSIFDGIDTFDTPKPSSLVKRMLQISTSAHSAPLREPSSSPDLILDFFAGSGTTAQAVLELNKEDGGNRKFILVQIPEPTGRKDYPTIAEITKERVRRVIKKMGEAEAGSLGLEGAASGQDRGFRVLAQGESNLLKWDPTQATDLESLERQLDLFSKDPLVPGWKPEDLLVEVMLAEGFSLTSAIEKKKAGANGFVRVSDPDMGYRLWTCFDKKLDFTAKDFGSLGLEGDDLVVFLDSSLSDTVKSALADRVRLKVV